MGLCSFDKFNSICRSVSIVNADAVGSLKVLGFPSTNLDGSMGGFGSLLLALVKEQKQHLLGSSRETEAVVRQWIEYSVCKLNNMNSGGLNHLVLKDINNSLAQQSYLAGNTQTIADIVFYHLLYEIMSKFSLQEKEQYIHLSRWYNNLQQDTNLKGSYAHLTFSRTPLY